MVKKAEASAPWQRRAGRRIFHGREPSGLRAFVVKKDSLIAAGVPVDGPSLADRKVFFTTKARSPEGGPRRELVDMDAPQRPAEPGRDEPGRGGDERLALFSRSLASGRGRTAMSEKWPWRSCRAGEGRAALFFTGGRTRATEAPALSGSRRSALNEPRAPMSVMPRPDSAIARWV